MSRTCPSPTGSPSGSSARPAPAARCRSCSTRNGAFADAASFARLVPVLLADGIKVLARAVPNHSHDVDPALARVLAVSQRPLAGAAFGEPAPAAAWRTRPAWGIVSSADHTINPDVERFGYQRAGIRTTEVDSSHLVMLSHPEETAAVIREALRA